MTETPTYDAAGNQVRALILGSSNSQRFQYDAANRLIKVKTDNNLTVIASYTYGDSNERLILEEAGLRTYYACDGSAEYTEAVGSNTPQWSKTYIYLGARLLSTLTPNDSGGPIRSVPFSWIVWALVSSTSYQGPNPWLVAVNKPKGEI